MHLENGGILTGRFTLPTEQASTPIPLLVCLHGGSYDSEYFDASESLSISRISKQFRAPVIAIDRPGYGGIHHVPPATPDSDLTYAQQQGKYINGVLLPAIWREYGERSNSAIVLLAHSIGAMMATITAGCYTRTEGYPLAGLITSGLIEPDAEFVLFDPAIKDRSMLQLPGMDLVSPDVAELTAGLNKPTPIGELIDINKTWLGYWHEYSHAVRVPLMYGTSEFDELWKSTTEALEKYRQAFPSSNGEFNAVKNAPHCIELSYQCDLWLRKCFDFAFRCIVQYEGRR
ncbi:hypothetical protein N7532_002836 [Penicillium argentinense]|uniref:AB hydrolase-1 domain-containing protein n=1 Tax=Penicillium argentinense TaxID=1131581 RepID=A0A9W9KLK6_9EURO|nr:uncharacterized protein N7532_002836 [Penicillium argentinense]KAJ5110191.1 hypothetical protein N7532_002836 [Penicillium argentinense]